MGPPSWCLREAPPEATESKFEDGADCPGMFQYCATPEQAIKHRLAVRKLRLYAQEAFLRCAPGGEAKDGGG